MAAVDIISALSGLGVGGAVTAAFGYLGQRKVTAQDGYSRLTDDLQEERAALQEERRLQQVEFHAERARLAGQLDQVQRQLAAALAETALQRAERRRATEQLAEAQQQL